MICVWWDLEDASNCLKTTPSVLSFTFIKFIGSMSQACSNDPCGYTTCFYNMTTLSLTLVIKTAIQELGWEVVPHPPHFHDLASSNCHLFRSIIFASYYIKKVFVITDDGVEISLCPLVAWCRSNKLVLIVAYWSFRFFQRVWHLSDLIHRMK